MIKKILTWAFVAFLIFFVAFQPDSAADVAKTLGAAVLDIARGFGNFFASLFS
ncbi:MAG TPA: hypothetical protein VFX60_02435 [Micromonospora sp.]|nr:hypothetical protein [Micromonospora sp.]